MGKHAPVVLLEEGKASQPVYDFLASIQPKFKDDPTLGPYNHGFLLGSTSDISFETQGILDERLEIVQESGQDTVDINEMRKDATDIASFLFSSTKYDKKL